MTDPRLRNLLAQFAQTVADRVRRDDHPPRATLDMARWMVMVIEAEADDGPGIRTDGAASNPPSRPWRNVTLEPPPTGERVEVWGRGWSSVAQGVFYGHTWQVWFGCGTLAVTPDYWRPLPQPPRWLKDDAKDDGPRMQPDSVVDDNGNCRKCGAHKPSDKTGVFGPWHEQGCPDRVFG